MQLPFKKLISFSFCLPSVVCTATLLAVTLTYIIYYLHYKAGVQLNILM